MVTMLKSHVIYLWKSLHLSQEVPCSFVYLIFNGDAPETMEEEEEGWLDVTKLLCGLMILLQGKHNTGHPSAVRQGENNMCTVL